MNIENIDQRLMRRLAENYRWRKFTNTNDYTEKELDIFVRSYVLLENICDKDRCDSLRRSLIGKI